ncbi:helix-turn-helix, Psq domain [Paracoccus alcaliphilus]|uniref:Helix-turn-helix, Psq domain n=1 Tax=Paracoccus alcaliphilus TaxID=34002 RepID=A0A1H8PMX0_9RHOB|nr:helix-turn-helix, Psq domain [Paracoccus alcaliphilus]
MELYLRVRQACATGMSQRQAATAFNISRDTVAKMMMFSVPPGYRRTADVKRPKLDPFIPIIEEWLEVDRSMPRKQRHTAKRVFDRLRAECGFTGGYTIIKDYIRERERRGQEVFVPLAHPPGHAQADFGEAMVRIGGVERDRRISSCWTCRTAMRAMCGPILRRWPRPGWTVTSTPSPSSRRFLSRSSMTTTAVWWRRSCRTAPASLHS